MVVARCPASSLAKRQVCSRTSVELALVVDHEHDLPVEDVVVDEAHADAGDVGVLLHLLELAAKEPRRGCTHDDGVLSAGPTTGDEQLRERGEGCMDFTIVGRLVESGFCRASVGVKCERGKVESREAR